jgi:arsenate reductase
MAAGLLQHLAGDRVEVRSAGTEPTDQINPAAAEAMAEIGIDIIRRAGVAPRLVQFPGR